MRRGERSSKVVDQRALGARPVRLRQIVLPTAAAAALAMGLSACGSASPPPVASLGKSPGRPAGHITASNNIPTAEAQFAHCIRTHGVPNFPYPTTDGTETAWIPSNYDTRTATFEAAWTICKNYIPGNPGNLNGPTLSPQQEAKMLKFAECMRAHGVTNFPDPPVAGGLLKPPRAFGTFDVNAAAVKRANNDCSRFGIRIVLGGPVHPCAFVTGAPATGATLAVDVREGLHPAEC